MKFVPVAVTASVAALLAASSAYAVSFPPVTYLTPYAIVSVGPSPTKLSINGPVSGKVLVGHGSSVASSGGNNGHIAGGAYADTQTLLNGFNSLQTKPVETLVSSTVTTGAFTQATGLQSYLDGLTTTQTLGALTKAQTITASGTMNVIQFSSLTNTPLTLSGSANDYFVLRTSGNVNTNQSMTLTGGITANHIIWDLDGTSGNVFQTSGGASLDGTFIDTKGGNFNVTSLNLIGQLINSAGQTTFGGSNSTISSRPFLSLATPEPSTWAMMILGVGMVGAAVRRRRAAAAANSVASTAD